jgi:hypothetical protein
LQTLHIHRNNYSPESGSTPLRRLRSCSDFGYWQMSSAVANMAHLTTLKIDHFCYKGDIPSDFFRLPKLQTVILDHLTLSSQSFTNVVEHFQVSKTLQTLRLDYLKYGSVAKTSPNFALFANVPLRDLSIMNNIDARGELFKLVNGTVKVKESFFNSSYFPQLRNLRLCHWANGSEGGRRRSSRTWFDRSAIKWGNGDIWKYAADSDMTNRTNFCYTQPCLWNLNLPCTEGWPS